MYAKKRNRKWYARANVRRTFSLIFVGMIIAVLILSALPLDTFGVVPVVPTSTISSDVFPEVPLGGTPVELAGTYFHPSGVFSLPLIRNWDKPAQSPEETVMPGGDSKISRVGVTFINSTAASVVHAFIENDPDRKIETAQDLDPYYTPDRLHEAWVRYESYRELNRRAEGNLFIINFELAFQGQTYLGRQISEPAGDWLKVMRLVVPGNNPLLLDTLQTTLIPQFTFWRGALAAPLNWLTLTDTGYMVRYPPDWQQTDGAPGRAYTFSAKRGNDVITMVTQTYDGPPLTGVEAAQQWVTTLWPRATIQTGTAETRGQDQGYTVSFVNRDADGNQRSMMTTFLNGSGNKLYTLTLQVNSGGRNLLTDTSLPELEQVRNAFFLLPVGQVIQQTPTPTPGS